MLIPPGESLPTPPPQPPATAHAHLDSSGPRAVPISASHTMTPCRSHFSHLQPAFQGGVPRRPPPALASLCLASLFGKTERKCLPWRFLRGFREPVSGKDLEHSLAHSTRSVAMAASRKPRAPPAAPPPGPRVLRGRPTSLSEEGILQRHCLGPRASVLLHGNEVSFLKNQPHNQGDKELGGPAPCL